MTEVRRTDEASARQVAPRASRPSESYSKSERLLRRSDFVRVQRSNRRFATRRLVVVWEPTRAERGRVGFTVSKKVGNSVVRSLVKRRLREIYRRNKVVWPPGLDVVVIARSAAATAPFDALRDDVLRWARKEGPETA